MYWGDHGPPHFHAVYGGGEAQVRIQDGRVLAGSLPRVAERLVREWATLRRSERRLGASAAVRSPSPDRASSVG
ncbi:MAG: DUF4160 domain-containing protein [Acidimicrobiales bacterium]